MKLTSILFFFQLLVLANCQADAQQHPQPAQQPPVKKDTLFDMIQPRDNDAPGANKLYKKQYASAPFMKRSASSTNSTSSSKNGTNGTNTSSSSDSDTTWQQSTKSSSSGSRLWSTYTIQGAMAGVIASFLLA